MRRSVRLCLIIWQSGRLEVTFERTRPACQMSMERAIALSKLVNDLLVQSALESLSTIVACRVLFSHGEGGFCRFLSVCLIFGPYLLLFAVSTWIPSHVHCLRKHVKIRFPCLKRGCDGSSNMHTAYRAVAKTIRFLFTIVGSRPLVTALGF